MEKDIHLFFADVLRERGNITEEQSDKLQQILFPGLDEDPNKKLIESAIDMTRAYDQWSRKRKQDEPEQLKPMTDDEIDNLASIM